MKEIEFLKIIKTQVGSDFLGDDCAYLKDFGIVITQDNLIEGIHFKKEWYTPYQLGYKAVIVNISDIYASGAFPKYLSIGLSLPKYIDNNFISEFYNGAIAASDGAVIVGGDITGSEDKIFISVTAIGSAKNRRISSRKNAKEGYVIVTTGVHGQSSAGLRELLSNGSNDILIKAHIKPVLDKSFSEYIASNINCDYAMMDTSDGFCDAMFKIAEASNTKIVVDYSKIPHFGTVDKFDVLFGGEDYKLVAAVPEDFAKKIPNACIVGYVTNFDGIRVSIDEKNFVNYNDLKVYNHF